MRDYQLLTCPYCGEGISEYAFDRHVVTKCARDHRVVSAVISAMAGICEFEEVNILIRGDEARMYAIDDHAYIACARADASGKRLMELFLELALGLLKELSRKVMGMEAEGYQPDAFEEMDHYYTYLPPDKFGGHVYLGVRIQPGYKDGFFRLGDMYG